ncbi:C2H2 type zinc finger domain protein [Colletotrichum higginsianum IMI 349063]|uniref:C2H2 type zinc finger domain protein n=3 Tax=Colletotrichum higginsianum (strain IMI 349063) TaxID=759273 RepID=A0A1B7Y0Y0_COLHI|nr:C2H2 type zinc finger domain protein [Colletotrichum higginsianum IMI 349063]OBR05655.1 C2H2 type zinc finger domain protein [Colletotrichum higginsianum IMI 349063]
MANSAGESEANQALHRCATCSRSFTRIENLKRHQKTHQPRLPHRCSVCRREFSRSDLLKKHRRLHRKSHGDDFPEKPQERSFPFVFEDPGSLLSRSSGDDTVVPSSSHPAAAAAWHSASTDGQDSAYSQHEGPTFGTTVNETCQDDTALVVADLSGVDIDFSGFFQPWGSNLWHGTTSQWFTLDFYDAVRETSNVYDPLLVDHGPPSFPDTWAWFGQDLDGREYRQDMSAAVPVPNKAAAVPPSELIPENTDATVTERTSRASSPPNVPSQEDGVAFAWDPSSRTLRQTHPVSIGAQHPLFLRHNPRFDMEESTWASVRAFLEPRVAHPDSDDLILPSLAVARVFLGLFFEGFYDQSPVLHLPSLRVDSLPAPLISAMIVIGATYSRIRHTRRFSILMLDRARQNLQHSIEGSRTLTRDPHIVYAYALLVYAGLWCGNKGAFEAAEASRGALVTYARRLLPPPPRPEPRGDDDEPNADERRWRGWVRSESHRRLRWYVFVIDAQFSVILNMRSSMSLAEVCRWECPSSERYWASPSATTWASLLDGSPYPPTRPFSLAYRALSMPRGNGLHASQPSPTGSGFGCWTFFLVLNCLASQGVDWSQDWSMNLAEPHDSPFVGGSHTRCTTATHNPYLAERLQARENILASLDAWYDRFIITYRETDSYFARASHILHGLLHIHLHTSLSDIQDALGKDGPQGVQTGLSRLQTFFAKGYAGHFRTTPNPPPESLDLFARVIADSVSIMGSQALQATAPYSIFGVFLSHVFLWAVTKTSPEALKAQLGTRLCEMGASSAAVGESELREVLELALSAEDGDRSRGVLVHAAQSLVRLGTWGASLNLALLLQIRANG